jgi:hypothetical protein
LPNCPFIDAALLEHFVKHSFSITKGHH